MNKDFERRGKAVFEALSVLADIDPKVVFLGGSAIQALLPKPRRLSIDLDVSYLGDPKILVEALEKSGYAVAVRKSRSPNFLFFTLDRNGVRIKLDVSRFAVPETVKRRLGGFDAFFPKECYFLAGKLSSLSYGAVGRFEEEPTQIVKDIFDINCLLDVKVSLDDVGKDWKRIISEQNKLRKTDFKEEECVDAVRRTLLKCVQAAPSPEFYVPQSALGSIQDSMLSGKIYRQDLAAMSARALLLLVNMNDGFYEIEKRVLAGSKELKRLDEAEKSLTGINVLSVEQIRALKIYAPKALFYLYAVYFPEEYSKNSGPVSTGTPGVRNPRH